MTNTQSTQIKRQLAAARAETHWKIDNCPLCSVTPNILS